MTPDKLTTRLGSHLGVGPPGTGVPAESQDFIDTLRGATLFALERGHDYVGTEHALFVLATDPGGPIQTPTQARLLEGVRESPKPV